MDHSLLRTRFHWAHWVLLLLPVFLALLEVLIVIGPRSQAFVRIGLQFLFGLFWFAIGFRKHSKAAITAYYVFGFPLIAWFLKSPEVTKALNTDMLGLCAIASIAVLGLSTLWGLIGVVAVVSLTWIFLGDFSQPTQLLTGTILMLSSGAFGAFIHWLIEHLDEAYQQLQLVALIDPMTGLGNRRKLELDFTACQDRNLLLYTVWDLDGLKRINDRQGHAAGDRYILEFVRALRLGTRGGDGLYRTGGDEFVGLHRVSDRVTPRNAKRLIERVRLGFANVSVGWVVAGANSFDEVNQLADQVLYGDKGRANRVTREIEPEALSESVFQSEGLSNQPGPPAIKTREFDRRANATSGPPVLTTPDHA
jgi:diguanylate cyclase (GGDEF)-like protein